MEALANSTAEAGPLIAEPAELNAWFEANLNQGCLNILYGVRGVGKTSAIVDFNRNLVARGIPPDNVVHIDFENRNFRNLRTCADVLDLLALENKTGIKYLFLDEVGYFEDHRKLLGVLFADPECQITIATSNSRVLHPDCLSYFSGRIRRFELLPNRDRHREGPVLERNWQIAMLRDVLGGNELADAYAEERLAEYIADTIGEFLSSRRIAEELTFGTRKMAHMTVVTYLAMLEEAFLIEKVPVWDEFSCTVSKRRNSYFFTDPEMRNYCFPSAQSGSARRHALNCAYSTLRRRFHRQVFRAQPEGLDFATVGPKNQTTFWNASMESPGEVIYKGER